MWSDGWICSAKSYPKSVSHLYHLNVHSNESIFGDDILILTSHYLHPTAEADPFLALITSGGQRSPNPVHLVYVFFMLFAFSCPSSLLDFLYSILPSSWCGASVMKKYSFLPDVCILWTITRGVYTLCSLLNSIFLSLCLWHVLQLLTEISPLPLHFLEPSDG